MKIRVLMLGESLERQGGIVSVEKLIIHNSSSDICLKFIPTLAKGSGVDKFYVFLTAILRLLWMIVSEDFDVVHIHVSERGSAFRQSITALIAIAFSIPVVMHAHSCDFHEFFPNLPSPAQSWIGWVFSKCSRFITLSNSWKNYYVNHLGLEPKKIAVMPNPVRLPDEVPLRSNPEQICFIFLGRIGYRKGAYDLVQSFARLPFEKKSCSRLTLAGDGDTEEIRSLVEKLCLAKVVSVLSWVDEEKRNALLAQSNVFVLPSYNEGLPMALIEAMSWGLPVVTTPVGGIPELIVHSQNGLLVEPGNIDQLSGALQSLIDNESLRLSIGEKARNSVRYLSIDKYLTSLIGVYESTLSR